MIVFDFIYAVIVNLFYMKKGIIKISISINNGISNQTKIPTDEGQ